MSTKRATPLVPWFTHRPRPFQKAVSAQAVASGFWAKMSSWSRKLYLKLWAAVERNAIYRPVSEVISLAVSSASIMICWCLLGILSLLSFPFSLPRFFELPLLVIILGVGLGLIPTGKSPGFHRR